MIKQLSEEKANHVAIGNLKSSGNMPSSLARRKHQITHLAFEVHELECSISPTHRVFNAKLFIFRQRSAKSSWRMRGRRTDKLEGRRRPSTDSDASWTCVEEQAVHQRIRTHKFTVAFNSYEMPNIFTIGEKQLRYCIYKHCIRAKMLREWQ